MIRSVLIFLFALALSAQEVKVQVISTNDMHGRIAPENPYSLKSEPGSWARAATLIRRIKGANPSTLLLDCGDNLEGDPICYIRNRLRTDIPDPSIAIMNNLGYNAMTVGTHDLDWGLPVTRSAEEQSVFPWLAANLESSGKPAFTPYVIHVVNGVRVGILGLSNSDTNKYRPIAPLNGLTITDAIACAQRYVPILKGKEKADVVIALFHSGSGSIQASPGSAHQAMALVERVPGIDLVMGGFSHEEESLRHRGVPILIGGCRGAMLCIAEVVIKKERNGWRLVSRDGRLQEVADSIPADPKVMELSEVMRNYADSYLNTHAAQLPMDLDGRWSRTEDSALVQLIHTVQKRATGADLSATHSPSMKIFIPRGPVSIRQLWAIAPFEAKVARISIKGLQLKQWLEHSARAFNFCHQPELFNKSIEGFNYDMIDGVRYILDLSKPVGQRVVELSYKGQPVRENQTFTMAINTYRLAGEGGYMEAIGFKGQAESVHNSTLRNLLFDYALKESTITLPRQNHWKIIPALDRERILAQARH